MHVRLLFSHQDTVFFYGQRIACQTGEGTAAIFQEILQYRQIAHHRVRLSVLQLRKGLLVGGKGFDYGALFFQLAGIHFAGGFFLHRYGLAFQVFKRLHVFHIFPHDKRKTGFIIRLGKQNDPLAGIIDGYGGNGNIGLTRIHSRDQCVKIHIHHGALFETDLLRNGLDQLHIKAGQLSGFFIRKLKRRKRRFRTDDQFVLQNRLVLVLLVFTAAAADGHQQNQKNQNSQ